MMGHEHEAVADAQDRNSEVENFRINLRRSLVVNTGWPAGENNSVWLCLRDLSCRGIKRKDFGIDLQLTNAPSDDLGVLRSEIEN